MLPLLKIVLITGVRKSATVSGAFLTCSAVKSWMSLAFPFFQGLYGLDDFKLGDVDWHFTAPFQCRDVEDMGVARFVKWVSQASRRFPVYMWFPMISSLVLDLESRCLRIRVWKGLVSSIFASISSARFFFRSLADCWRCARRSDLLAA